MNPNIQTIPAKFKSATDKFGDVETLNICHGTNSWNLILKKRTNKVELHSGWSVLWKELHLVAGDICVSRVQFQTIILSLKYIGIVFEMHVVFQYADAKHPRHVSYAVFIGFSSLRSLCFFLLSECNEYKMLTISYHQIKLPLFCLLGCLS